MILPKRGQVFLWSGSTVQSWFIKKVTKSNWSHTGFFISEDKILDSDWDGVKIRDAKPYLDTKRLCILDLNLTDVQIEKALTSALDKVKDKDGYDYRLMASMAWAYITGKKNHQHIRDWKGAFICSELVAQAVWDAANIKFVAQDMDIDWTTPEDIWRYQNKTIIFPELKNLA